MRLRGRQFVAAESSAVLFRKFGGTTHEPKVHMKSFTWFRRAKRLGVSTGIFMELSLIARRTGVERVMGTEGRHAVDVCLCLAQFIEAAMA